MKLKQILKAALAVSLFALVTPRVHAVVVYNGSLANETGLAYDNTYPLDLGNSNLRYSNIDSLTFQAAYTSATFANSTFTDGTAATGTITISTTSLSTITGARGTDTIIVATNTTNALNSASFTLNGIKFVQGDLWSRAAVSSNTAISINNAINGYGSVNTRFVATVAGATVTITCVSTGTACNSYTLTATGGLKANAATFSGGINNAFIIINGITLLEGTNWFVTTASGTAKSISDAIQATSSLSTIIASTWTTVATSSFGVVSATATAAGTAGNYGWVSSKTSVISMSSLQLVGGTASAIGTSANTITIASHGYPRGLDLLYTKTAGTSPGQLVANTTYYVIPVDVNKFKLSSTKAGAAAGTGIVSIGTQTLTGGGSFAFTPSTYTGTASFKWQVSNDNSNWTDLAVSSVTVTPTTPATTSVWDLGAIAWRYIRLKVVAPTKGGLYLLVTGVGKSSD